MEFLDIINDQGLPIGIAPRSVCHGNPALTHRTAHVIIRSSDGRFLLQKRSMAKDTQPGKWDTAVGGHLALGEDYADAARREMTEEIGTDAPITQLFTMAIRNAWESEQTMVFSAVCDGPFTPQADEIDELRFWSAEELKKAIGTGCLTPYLEYELNQLRTRGILD